MLAYTSYAMRDELMEIKLAEVNKTAFGKALY